MKEYKHIGVYGLILKDNKIVLIRKVSGPYDGKLDLPGGTIELGERPEETLKRELNEEVGILVSKYNLFDADSVSFDWNYKNDIVVKVHHIGIIFNILEYLGEIKNEVIVDEVNDDSLGANFYDIDKLQKSDLSQIAIMELEKLGYSLKE